MKCGFYEKEITPPLGGCMPGYFSERLAEDVILPLYAKALAIEAAGNCVLMVAMDGLFVDKYVYDIAVKRITERTGIPADRIMINATHAHTGGPVKSLNDPPFYKADPEYLNVLARSVADCGILAWQRLAPATAKFAQTDVYGISFIRNFRMKDGSIRTNPGRLNPEIVEPLGQIDPAFPVLFFFDEAENPIGMLSNFALHHDCVAGTRYCSDYSGVMGREMKKTFGMDFVSVFINGACGNINHVNVEEVPHEKRDYYLKNGLRLAEEAKRLYGQAEAFPIDTVDGKLEHIAIPRHQVPAEEVEEVKHLIATIPMEGLEININNVDSPEYKRAKADRLLRFINMPDELPVPVQALRIGGAILFSASGEIFTEYGKYMKAHSPLPVNMVAEIANGGPSCYIPTPQAFHPTVYESRIPSSMLIPEAGATIAELAVKLAKELV